MSKLYIAKLVDIIKGSDLPYNTLKRMIEDAHNGKPHGIVDNDNLHLFRQYRNRVSADPAAMLREAGFPRPAELAESEELTRKLESELRQLERFEKERHEGYWDEETEEEYFEGCEDWAYPARVSSIHLYEKALKEARRG